MTRTPHDALGKALLRHWLSPVGRVETSHELNPPPRWVDLAFWPHTPQPAAPHLGLLERMARSSALFELFRDPVDAREMEEAVGKLLEARAEVRRQARRTPGEARIGSERLWVLTPTVGNDLLDAFGARVANGWFAGFYFLPPGLFSALVVLHRLPELPETLWLRLLGRNGTQRLAIREVQRLPSSHPLREGTLHAFMTWRRQLLREVTMHPADQEFLDNTEELYLQWEQEVLARGLAPLVRLFERKLGRSMSPDERDRLRQRLATEGPERLGDVGLDLDGPALEAWLNASIA